VWTKKENSGLL